MKRKQNNLNFIIIAIIVGALAGGITSYVVDKYDVATEEELIKEFYDVETATHVSPHGLRKHLGDQTSVIVDLRSQEEYEEEHVITALNVPAYKDKDHSDYGAIERIRQGFTEIRTAHPNKDIVVYCYSTPCMTGRKVGKILADDGIYVKHLGIGWNEWRYHWNTWNHPHEWEITNVKDYIASGPEPGVFDADLTGTGCPIEGGLGC